MPCDCAHGYGKNLVDALVCKQVTNLKLQDFPDRNWVLLIDETEFTHICNVCQDVSFDLSAKTLN